MENNVAKINALPRPRTVRSLEHPLISMQHGRTINFRPYTSRMAHISVPHKFRKSSKYLQVSGK
jgi:hypothetical protein